MSYNNYHPISSATSTIYKTPIPPRNNSKSGQFSTDPAVTGPGLWYRIHTSGAKIALSGDESKIDIYIDEVKEIVDTHNCGECRDHGAKYLRDNPMENYRHVRDEEGRLAGMFRHGWMFHNTVNARLGKEQMPYETVWQMFSQLDNPTCMTSCAIRKNDTDSNNHNYSAPGGNTSVVTGHYIDYSSIDYNNGYPHIYDNDYQRSNNYPHPNSYTSSSGYTVRYH